VAVAAAAAAAAKVHTCRIGADPAAALTGLAARLARSYVRRTLAIPAAATVILFAGRFTAEKGVDVLAAVVWRFASRGGVLPPPLRTVAGTSGVTVDAPPSPLVLVFVGNGSQLPLLTALAAPDAATAPLVRLVPPLSDPAALAAHYAAADVLVLPSANEGIALVVYEAMAAGQLVMTTDVGGQAEVVTD